MQKKRLLVGLCSWDSPLMLKACIHSLLQNLDLNKDGIAVVLNDADNESISFLLDQKIPFVCLPDNRGVLAIDYLKPFIENSEYFLNTNDDMLFCANFADDLIDIITKNYPASSSCRLVESFDSGNHCVVVDDSFGREINKDVYDKFIEKFNKNIYTQHQKTISYNHPICVKSQDFLKVGGYSGNWDMTFFSGYGRDDMFAFKLWQLHNFNFRHICSEKSFVFHASSATMKKLSPELKNQNNFNNFALQAGISIPQFHSLINIGKHVQ